MTAFGILQLVGASVLFVIAVIVFLVVFFRGMSWLDAWIKRRAETDLKRVAPRRPKRRRRTVSREQTVLGSANSVVLSPARLRMIEQMAQAKLLELQAQTQTFAHDSPSSALSSADAEAVALNAQAVASKRLATVHLNSGEVISGVRILSKDESEREIGQLGVESELALDCVVFEDDAGRICLVHSKNLKMLAWSRETKAGQQENCPGK